MPYPNIAIPTYAELEPRVVEWAADRKLINAGGQPLKATPMAQHGKTLEEIGEAKDALEYWLIARDNREELEQSLNRDVWASVDEYLAATKNDLALELGDILVTLSLQAAMHGTTLERCKVEAGRLIDWPFTWDYVSHWASVLSDSLENPSSSFRFDVPGAVGAIALCVEEIARIELMLMGPEVLALALAKIEGRQGEVVDGVFVKAVA